MSEELLLEEINEIETALAEGGSSYQEMLVEERLVWLKKELANINNLKENK